MGGIAAALHAGHRISFDHDHVVSELSKNYERTTAALEAVVGWRTRRRIKGKLALGEIDGIDAGVCNQPRSTPLATTTIELNDDSHLRIPTVEEMLRIKTFLVVERNATRDYLDITALSHHLGMKESVAALEHMNELYAEFAGEDGDMLPSVLVNLSNPDPYDLTDIDLTEYKGMVAPRNDWNAVETQCRALAVGLLAP